MSFKYPQYSKGAAATQADTTTAPSRSGATHVDHTNNKITVVKRKSPVDALVPSIYNDRGVFGGGSFSTGTTSSKIDYITISTPGNASNFGDLQEALLSPSATSNSTNGRGVFGGGAQQGGIVATRIQYNSLLTTGNATYFGALSLARQGLAATSNGTNERGIFGGGYTSGVVNTIDYVTISSIGNATTFGVLTSTMYYLAATSNGTSGRGVFGGGYTAGQKNTISYVTINTAGNAASFGSLTAVNERLAATSNGTNERGIFGGGNSGGVTNVIAYITISTLGNATSFGLLTAATEYLAATSNGINNRGVFGGGYNSSYTEVNTISYIAINSTGNATSFGALTVARMNLAATSNAA